MTEFDRPIANERRPDRIRRGETKPSWVTATLPIDIPAIREKLGKSQTQFARMIGVSLSTLRDWEHGRRSPDGPALALLRVAAAIEH